MPWKECSVVDEAEKLLRGGESHQKCWTTSDGECDAADRDRAARGEQELATG